MFRCPCTFTKRNVQRCICKPKLAFLNNKINETKRKVTQINWNFVNIKWFYDQLWSYLHTCLCEIILHKCIKMISNSDTHGKEQYKWQKNESNKQYVTATTKLNSLHSWQCIIIINHNLFVSLLFIMFYFQCFVLLAHFKKPKECSKVYMQTKIDIIK